MRKPLGTETVQAEDGTILELTAYSEETEAGEASAANRRQLRLTLTRAGEPPVELTISGAGAETITRIAAEAGLLIESEADTARRYLANFREILHAGAVAELERRAGAGQ
ncbi:hypothetical protein [Arthrobacter caoxuetaonis]|uniref:Uncharacterized protein n=1 Tax=Arthrobacter caoxuetaonis TaxID=2886935 RepID=A0A9X1SGW0_9MICC|nr:hypothetical protein [Arthrobacter caoxuetaonis]MCC3299789.1 hypothetical protein [Arthrobacter caoxuetaonis]USQ59311.1 hypothetical protein NF551_17145 [Arthrobacter caoxuetaonis]